MVDDAVWGAAVVLAFAAVAQWRRAWTLRWAAPARWLAWTLTAFATSAALFTEGANRLLSAATGLGHVGDPLARTALLAAAWLAPVLLVALTSARINGSAVRRRALPCAAAVVILWAAYLSAAPTALLRSPSRDVAPDVGFVTYTLAGLAALTVALIEVAVDARRYATTATGPLRTGLRIVHVGCLLGLGYVLTMAVTTAAAFARPGPAANAQAGVGRALAVIAGLTVAAGCLTPAVSKTWHTIRRAT